MAKTVSDFFVFEMSTGQMVEDVGSPSRARGHVHFYGRPGGVVPTPVELYRIISRHYYQAQQRQEEEAMKTGLRAAQAVSRKPTSTTAPAAATASSTGCSWKSSTRWTCRDKAICVAPAGCGMLLYNYFDIDMIESAHGRGAAVATGIKRVLPDNLVFSYQGDGDLAAIGTAEGFHAANRGENITVIFVNNGVYGMTGGQMAPTTLLDQVTTTTPLGRDSVLAGHPVRDLRGVLRARRHLLPRAGRRQQAGGGHEGEEGHRQGLPAPARRAPASPWSRSSRPARPTGRWAPSRPARGSTRS